VPDQAETIVEQLCNTANSKRAGAARRKFDGERDPVKTAADRGDDRRIGIAQCCVITTCRGPLHEKLHGRVRERSRHCEAALFRRATKCVQQVDMFSFNPESFATRC
jgi:hypothetical protein